jgi:hypothetical protein
VEDLAVVTSKWGSYFQHSVLYSLPLINMVLPMLQQRRDVKVLVDSEGGSFTKEVLLALGVEGNQIMLDDGNTTYTASHLYVPAFPMMHGGDTAIGFPSYRGYGNLVPALLSGGVYPPIQERTRVLYLRR